jgi:hypothetical protein
MHITIPHLFTLLDCWLQPPEAFVSSEIITTNIMPVLTPYYILNLESCSGTSHVLDCMPFCAMPTCVNKISENKIRSNHCEQTKQLLKCSLLIGSRGYSSCWALLEKAPVAQLLKNFTAYYGSERFIYHVHKSPRLAPSLNHSIFFPCCFIKLFQFWKFCSMNMTTVIPSCVLYVAFQPLFYFSTQK